jgi:hypothetical protein
VKVRKALIGLKRNFKILENVIDVMAQTKRSVEGTTHLDTNVKRFKKIVKALKEKKNSRR